MIIKNIKTLYNFFSKRKFLTIISMLLFLIVASLDNIIIFLTEYEIRNILENLSITKISKILLIIIIVRFFFQIIILNHNKMQFLKIFINSLKKFFSSLTQNKALFGQTHMLDNILKFQWEMKFISGETNYYYIKILSNISYFVISLISIFRILSINNDRYHLISFIVSFLLLMIICILNTICSKIDINNFKSIDGYLSSTNTDIIKYTEDEKIQNNNSKYQAFIDEKLKNIKSFLTKILAKKAFLEFLIFFFSFGGFFLVYYLTSLSFLENRNSIFISFLIYNGFIIFFGFGIYKNINDKNIISIISQHNTLMVKKDNTKLTDDDPILNSGNEIIIENLEFQDVNLKSKDNLFSIENVNFFAKIKDNIAFLSSEKNISLIRNFFQNNQIKNSGKITINSYELEDLNKENLSHIISTISNDIDIKNDTVKNNITLNNSQLSDDIIIKASKLSHLYNFIASLPLGFYTILNNSITLTEIEKFQISLTRALLGDAHIIIVDFTQLDENNSTISLIKEMLFSSLVDRILIVLTKNTFGMKEMSQIIFYDDKNVIGYGIHDDLLKSNKKYSDFYLKHYNNIEFSE
jgi:ABC-type multidrug transport system fused ATPase/permease subunit